MKQLNSERAILFVESLQTVSDLVNNGIEIENDNIWDGKNVHLLRYLVQVVEVCHTSHVTLLSAFGMVLLDTLVKNAL